MILVRRFIFEEDPEYGNNGWRPLWMKGATANSGDGRLAAHDILEHHPSMQLGAEAELHALGASYWIRGENGFFNGDATDNYASDFIEMLRRVHYGQETLNDPGVTRPLSESLYGDADETLQTIVRKGFKMAHEEHSYSDDGELELPPNAQARALGWMRKGYRYARQRYSDADGYGMNCLFVRAAEAVDRVTRHSDLGMEMVVRLDTRRCTVKAHADYPSEYGY